MRPNSLVERLGEQLAGKLEARHVEQLEAQLVEQLEARSAD